MNKFSFSIPQKLICGAGASKEISEVLEALSLNRVLLVSDKTLLRLGKVDSIRDICTGSGVEVWDYLDVEENPSLETVNRAIKEFRDHDCEGIIAIGGGSPMDVAKSAAAAARSGRPIEEYAQGLPITEAAPVIAVPTTAGTGSEVTRAAVVTDGKTHRKLSLMSDLLIPKAAIVDPELIYTLPAKVAAATGMDAFIHAMEAYLSRQSTPYTDALAEKAMELIGGNLRRYVEDRSDEEAAAAMMYGSTFAGLAFTSAKLGNIHAMSHPISAVFGIAHGIANAILMPVVLGYNKEADTGERYERIYRYLGGTDSHGKFSKEMTVDLTREWLDALEIPQYFTPELYKKGEAAFDDTVLDKMANDAMMSGNIAVNPRETKLEDVKTLYKQAFLRAK